MKEARADPGLGDCLGGRPHPRCTQPGGSLRPAFLSESFTPDHKPLMGEAPELRGFFLGCGFNSAGECGQQPTQHPRGLSGSELPLVGWGAGPGALCPLMGGGRRGL